MAATLRAEPGQSLLAALTNTARQLVSVSVGDTLGPQYLVATVGLLLRTYFPAAEMQRFLAGRQVAGSLPALAAPLRLVHLALLCLGAAGTLAILVGGWRRSPVLAGLAAMVTIGVLANAFATGALSGPHDRYGARAAWLLLLPPLVAVLRGKQRLS